MNDGKGTAGNTLGDVAPDPRWVRWIVGIVFVATLVPGLIGLWFRVSHGHLSAGYGSYVPWGLWVALYFHGVGIAGGAFVVGGLGHLFDWAGFSDRAVLRATIALSVAALLPALLAIWLDLGRMDRAMEIFLRPNFTSMMAFNAWMYGLFLLLAAVLWVLSFGEDRGWLKPMLCLAMLFALLFPSQSGAFFGVVEAKKFWHSALLPFVFLTSALVAGTAVLYVLHALRARSAAAPSQAAEALGRLRRLLQGLLVAYFGLEFAEFSIYLWNPGPHAPEVNLILSGPYWWVFWVVHLLLSGLLPFVLLALRWRPGWLAAALLAAVGFVSARLNILIPAQTVGELRGLVEAFRHPRLEYSYEATTAEYLVGLLLVAVGLGVFLAARRAEGVVLRLRAAGARAEEKHHVG